MWGQCDREVAYPDVPVSPSDEQTWQQSLQPQTSYDNISPSTLFVPDYGFAPDYNILPPLSLHCNSSHETPAVDESELQQFPFEPDVNYADTWLADLSAEMFLPPNFDFGEFDLCAPQPDLYAPQPISAIPPLLLLWDSPTAFNPQPSNEPIPDVTAASDGPPPLLPSQVPSNPEVIAPPDTNEDHSVRVYRYIHSQRKGGCICTWVDDTGKPCGYQSNIDMVKRHIWRVHFELKCDFPYRYVTAR